nr:PREDICTED: peroxisomal carnitine O-octanoyltransferase [Latimeria chalumnae]|eukprot:XP_014345424.1 PREDICTED: peroxisomal carnitine O-octanoyltransferase [Latimeria chalumnae]
MENQVFESRAERTFQHQNSLPSLPVPSLDESLKKYLDAVKPFLSDPELQKTTEIVEKFQYGIGKELHQKLLERAKVRRNWLEEWWLNTAYLDVRMPSQLNVNFGGPAPYLEHYWPPKDGTQLERGSIAVYYMLQYWNLIRIEQLPVHKTGSAPLDMDQFRMLYCTCKVPGVTRDSMINYFRTESEGKCPTHLVVMCRGRVFAFDAVHDGRILTPPEILRFLGFIYFALCCYGGIHLVCNLAREYLINLDPRNPSILETIQSSLFVISIDDASPYATAEDYKQHAPYDAMVLVAMCYYIDCEIKATEGKWKGSNVVCDIPWPDELIFKVDQKVLEDIECAKQQYQQQASDIQIANSAFTSFGKALIKKKKLHPDTFVQLGLQLAYYKIHGGPGCCYETATTRRFYHGRTETMRPCTVEATEWCKAMLNPSFKPEKRRELMLNAFAKHNRLMSECQNGRGFDRHLLGLLLIAKDQGLPVPDLYLDSAFTKSGGGGNFVLSTSLVGYTTVHGAVVPMVKHGYGFFYQIRDDRIVAACTAWKSCPDTDAEKLYRNLCQSFHEMIELMTEARL